MKKTGRAGLIFIKDIRRRESGADLTFA
jgi:hypothetical protein